MSHSKELENLRDSLNKKKAIEFELLDLIEQHAEFIDSEMKKSEESTLTKVFQPYIDVIKKALEKKHKKQFSDAIIYNNEGKILMLLRSSNAIIEPNKWGLPGGHIDPGETPEQAVKREALEETGIVVNVVSPKLSKQLSNCTLNFFECRPESNEHRVILDASEHTNHQWVNKEELQELDCVFDLKDILNNIIFVGDKIMKASDAIEVIMKAFDQGLIDENQYFDALEKAKKINSVKVDVTKFLSNHTEPGNLYKFEYNGKTLYIARHGETEDNVAGKLRTPDTKLTAKGKAQIIKLRDELKEKKIKVPLVITSKLPRAVQTAEGMDTGAKIEKVDWLVTWDLGKFEGTIEKDSKEQLEEDARKDQDKKVGGNGESFNQFKDRVIGNLKKVLKTAEENTLIVTHSSVVKMIQAWEKADNKDDISIDKIKKSTETIKVPDDHEIGMKVPKGGSNCGNCEYVSQNKKHCSNEFFIAWNKGSTDLPEKADEYCCDYWEHAEIKKALDTLKIAFDNNQINEQQYFEAVEKSTKGKHWKKHNSPSVSTGSISNDILTININGTNFHYKADEGKDIYNIHETLRHKLTGNKGNALAWLRTVTKPHKKETINEERKQTFTDENKKDIDELTKAEPAAKIGDEKEWHGRKFKFTVSGWAHADDKQSALKTEKAKDKMKLQDFSDDELNNHAHRSSVSDLQKIIKEGRNPKLREVAMKHLATRNADENEHSLYDMMILEETGDNHSYSTEDKTIHFDTDPGSDLISKLTHHGIKYIVNSKEVKSDEDR